MPAGNACNSGDGALSHFRRQFTPSFSVIISTYERPAKLRACLTALANQDYRQDRFEVIVVDDGGRSNLNDILVEFDGQLQTTLVIQPNRGPAAARNHGAARASGDLLAFTDDDCTADPNWLTALADRLKDNSVAMVGGQTLNQLPNNPYSATSQLIVDMIYRHYNADPEQARFLASNNLAIPKRTFLDAGGFDTAFRTSEDRELCDRFLFKGQRLVFASKAVIHHAHDLTFRQFCGQHFNYGRGAHRYHQLRAKRGSGRMRTELKFHMNVRNWLLLPFANMSRRQIVKIATLMIVWQVVNAAGFFWQALRQKRQAHV